MVTTSYSMEGDVQMPTRDLLGRVERSYLIGSTV